MRIFPGLVIPLTSKLALQWLPCQAPGFIGSGLELVGLVSLYCDWVTWQVWFATSVSVWQHVQVFEQMGPWDALYMLLGCSATHRQEQPLPNEVGSPNLESYELDCRFLFPIIPLCFPAFSVSLFPLSFCHSSPITCTLSITPFSQYYYLKSKCEPIQSHTQKPH